MRVAKNTKTNLDLSTEAINHLLYDKNLCIHKRVFQDIDHFKELMVKHNIPYKRIHVRDFDNCVIVELDEMITGQGTVVKSFKKKERK